MTDQAEQLVQRLMGIASDFLSGDLEGFEAHLRQAVTTSLSDVHKGYEQCGDCGHARDRHYEGDTSFRCLTCNCFVRKDVSSFAKLFTQADVDQAVNEARLDTCDRIEAERVKEPVLFGQNALPLAVVTVSAINNQRRRITGVYPDSAPPHNATQGAE
jgi:hypothetical protein